MKDQTSSREGRHAAAEAPRKHSKFTRTFRKAWAVIYLLFLLVFEIVLFLLDVLPVKILLGVFIVLFVVSALIYYLLAKRTARRWVRVVALALSCVLMAVYGFGTVYAMNTMSFLGFITKRSQMEGTKDRIVEEPFILYITGIDSWSTIDEPGRSDVNMVVVVNPETHKILLVSIPRDYKINVVGTGYTDKLTHTGIHGVDMTLSSVEDLLDIHIDYYVKVNFNTVRKYVDAIDGVDVVSEYDFYSDYGGDHVEYHFVEGVNHLDGAQALAFARERKSFATGDHQRVRNQQLVFKAILDKTMKSSTILLRYNTILGNLRNYLETDMSPNDIKALIKYQMLYMRGWSIDSYSLTGPGSTEATYSAGVAYIMLHDEYSVETAHNLITAVMNDEVDLSQYYYDEEEAASSTDVIGGVSTEEPAE
ncbi:MAG: LCP family protein [Mogibacterium sp.]|nr:LCP family protein [Mogibacterium sp.]